MRYYTGNIIPSPDNIFVFGSNPEGRHGAGAAKTARLQFGAVYGQGEGLQNHSYAIPTKDLRITENFGYRSIPTHKITASIRRMYDCAKLHPEWKFCIAYRNTGTRSLNGYTGFEMMRMFRDAGPIPDNVYISKEWYDTGFFIDNNKKI